MEVSSFSFQEDHYTNSFFQEPEPLFMTPADVSRKRPYGESNGASLETDSSVEDLLAEFLSFEPQKQAKQETEHYNPSKRARSDSDDSNVTGIGGAAPQRRLWVKDRSSAWWERASSPDFPESDFRRAFRMSRATFDFVCGELEPAITKRDTALRSAIPVPQRVAVCLWRLATGEALRAVSARFGLGISTCHKLVLEVCTAVRTVLMPKFLRWPEERRMSAVKTEFERLSGIPSVGGAIYTTHVPIVAPKQSPASYFNKGHTERNRKTSYSVAVQGVVDRRGSFTDISVGWPGAMTDEQVLERSSLFHRAGGGGARLLGGSSFPLTEWLMVPYYDGGARGSTVTWTKNSYNKNVEEVVSRVARGAFAGLKGRWGCLRKRTEMKLEDLPAVLAACCVLHNVCGERGDGLLPEEELGFELFDDGTVPENPVRSAEAERERDRIAHGLLHHDHAGTIVV